MVIVTGQREFQRRRYLPGGAHVKRIVDTVRTDAGKRRRRSLLHVDISQASAILTVQPADLLHLPCHYCLAHLV